ncbi:uncharacterized protein BHQ10_008923 [Talaromyces amestolkiae]|uniref:Uncharacterized protein n=1 Tax=Talaromyces amestolkiae TaxID=1196081 RepID=A0A364LB22_TALAM|nr:uncharacterized protein BHQ10_008923 [Talaromyces amestolkiae]RAO72911.1 hypothetical protein BHQ10_008923 [Talaromyces amestolkiae]
MKTTLPIALLALNGWTATALPIHHYDIGFSDTVATTLHTTYDHAGPFPVMTKSSSTKKHAPHFLEWWANEHSKHRDALLHATETRPSAHHRDGSSSGSNWSDKARKMINTWSAFYGTEYPTKPSSSSSARPTSFDSGNDNSIATDPLIVGDACGVIVENSADGETSFTTIPCPSIQSSNTRPHRPGYFEQLRHNLATMDVAMICSRYGPELVALCIFLLVPISVVVVEIIDAVQDKIVIEKFPDRGRGRVRLTEPERRMSVLAKCEREKIVRDQAQKSWVSSRRGSRHAST